MQSSSLPNLGQRWWCLRSILSHEDTVSRSSLHSNFERELSPYTLANSAESLSLRGSEQLITNCKIASEIWIADNSQPSVDNKKYDPVKVESDSWGFKAWLQKGLDRSLPHILWYGKQQERSIEVSLQPTYLAFQLTYYHLSHYSQYGFWAMKFLFWPLVEWIWT